MNVGSAAWQSAQRVRAYPWGSDTNEKQPDPHARHQCTPNPRLLSTELVSSPSSSARRRSSPMSSRAGRFPAAAVAARSGEASTTPALELDVTSIRRRQDAAALPDAPGELREVRRRRRDRPMGRVRQPLHPPDGGPCRYHAQRTNSPLSTLMRLHGEPSAKSSSATSIARQRNERGDPFENLAASSASTRSAPEAPRVHHHGRRPRACDRRLGREGQERRHPQGLLRDAWRRESKED